MQRIWRSQRRLQRGQGLAEFALALPILMLILLLCLDFGRVFLGWVTLNNAARVAANYGATNPGTWTAAQSTMYTNLIDRETSGIDCDLATPYPTPSYPGSAGTGLGGRSEVSLTCSFGLITPFLSNLLGSSSVPVGATADMPIRIGTVANLSPGASQSVGLGPNASFTATPTSGVAPLTVNFADTSTGAPQTWLWDFGDGSQDNAQNVSHTYASPGSYTVTLTVTNGGGQGQATTTITVDDPNAQPAAGFYGTVPAPCVTSGAPASVQCGGSSLAPIFYTWPMTVNFTNTSTNTAGATFAWDFGDGGTDATASPSHVYNTPGSYKVSLTVTTGAGSSTSFINNYVNAGCVIPSFIGHTYAEAGTLWTSAHFLSSNIYYYDNSGQNGSYGNSIPNGSSGNTIAAQNPQGSAFTNATDSGGSWQCTSTVRVATKNPKTAP